MIENRPIRTVLPRSLLTLESVHDHHASTLDLLGPKILLFACVTEFNFSHHYWLSSSCGFQKAYTGPCEAIIQVPAAGRFRAIVQQPASALEYNNNNISP